MLHHGAQPAIDFLGRRWTYRELGDLVRQTARGLQDLGVKPGMRVGLCLPNTPYFVIFYFAVLRIGGLAVDQESREVALDGEPVQLTRTEFDLLVAFMSRPRRVWERDTLARLVWHTDWPGEDHVIDVHVANLRRKLGESAHEGHWVHTVRGVGYRFGSPEAED